MRKYLASLTAILLVLATSCTQLPVAPATSQADVDATIEAAVAATVAAMTGTTPQTVAPTTAEAIIGTPIVQATDANVQATPTEVGIGPIITGTVIEVTPITATAVVTATTQPTGTTQPPATTIPSTTVPGPTVPITATITVTATLAPTDTVEPDSADRPDTGPITGPITGTITVTATLAPTATEVITGTPNPGETVVPTTTVIPTGTVVPTSTVIPTSTVVPTATVIPTSTVVQTPTFVPTGTIVPTGTVVPTTTAPPITPSPTAPPSATPTPTPSPTATPTPGPSPTPTTMPSTVFMGSYRSYAEGSSLVVVGEVINGMTAPVYGVKIIATFHDAGGNLVGATEAAAYLPQMQPTQANPFRLNLANAPASIQSFELTLRWDEISFATYDRATIISEEVKQENGTEITGEIRNDHRSDLRNLVVVATFYDESGAVLDVVPGRSSIATLAPGNTATFSVQTRQAIPFATYLVQIEGMLYQ